jgi:periplasmic protein TonB
MITRALSSATAGLAVTTGLLFVMQILIATGEEIVVEPRPRYFLTWVSPKDPPDTPVKERLPKKPDPPRSPPNTHFADATETKGIGVGFPTALPVLPTGTPTLTGIGTGDGPLINIIKVQPQYPIAAMTKGLDGTVIVQFDVAATGAVENVVVVESSNKVFNKAAIEAAYRFKYKPRVVDGVQLGAKGLQQLFRFEMEE